MEIDCSHKEGPMQGRHQMKEICVYTVKDGKIVRAEFFYDMPEGC
jgi:ketosteroid isomerase-like protein